MVKKNLFTAFSFLMIFSMLLAACAAPAATTVEKTVIVEKIVTQEVVKTVEVEKPVEVQVQVEVTSTPEPVTRTGAWVDDLVFTAIGNFDEGIKQLQAGAIDVYANGRVSPESFKVVKVDPALSYIESYGLYHAIQMNPVGPVMDNGLFNPFGNQKIREAMNWLVDRSYLAQEIYAGSATPKFTALGTAWSDYARSLDVGRAIENKYAYNFDKAKEVFDAEMPGMGATLVDGKWTYNDAPIVLTYLIRKESALRQAMGDYVSNQLEALGFAVDRQYKTSREASALWVATEPKEGLWHLYTGAWSATAITRDQGWVFSSFYTTRAGGIPLYQAFTPDPAFDDLALRLETSKFADLAERKQMMADALNMSMENSYTVFLIDEKAFTAYSANVQIAYDLAAGITGNAQWPFTLRFKDQVGGTAHIATENLLVDPWNPVAGSNWLFDAMPQRGTRDYGFMPDPYTGLSWPQRAEKATVIAQEGLSVFKTQDWLTLEFKPTIEVPADAWYEWDAANQKFITVGEAFTATQTAKAVSIVTYPGDMFDTVTWHDGSKLSVGDFVMGMIMSYDQAKEESAIYDASSTTYESLMSYLKGFRITSTNPLVIETYVDLYYLDAEDMVFSWWPQYIQGPGSWTSIAIGARAEAAKLGAFSSARANELQAENEKVEWLSYIAGPSLEILRGQLISATAENYIPYAPTMGEFVTAEEATARWAAYNDFYKTQGHFWLGTGPFMINKAFPVEGSITLSRYEAYPDLSNKWDRFGVAKIAEVSVDGAGQVKIGDEGKFDVFITFQGEPYLNADLESVKYLLFDSAGSLVATGDAVAGADGEYTISLPADVTGKLTEGSNKLEVAVSSKLVALSALGSFEFVTVK